MSVSVREKADSPQVSTGNNPSAELRFIIKGTEDDAEARMELAVVAPSGFDLYGTGLVFLPRVTLSVDHIGYELWEGAARYEFAPSTEESQFSFDTGGGTQHITQSLATVGYAPPEVLVPNYRGAIGVTADSVEGVDITVPVYQFAETHYLPPELVTDAYKGTLFALTGRVNSAPFKGFAAGECLFLGASGSKRGTGDWEITYRFAASPNVTGLTIGDITGIAKKGWEYLWVRYQDAETDDGKWLIKKPVAVYVEQVYPSGDFGGLGI